MGYVKLGLAAVAALCLLVAVPQGAAQAAQEGVRFHHGKRTQELYCLKRNHWWFYRPYTTAQEDFPRCEPYFHYLEPVDGRRGARSGPYIK